MTEKPKYKGRFSTARNGHTLKKKKRSGRCKDGLLLMRHYVARSGAHVTAGQRLLPKILG